LVAYGVLGPRRIVVNDPDYTPASPYQILNNDYSILNIADLVMIDPVGTGLSIPIGEHEFDEFWGVDQDIRTISLFHYSIFNQTKSHELPQISVR
tara:strand:+ start:166 stop:450 length:285 start_codon:yes stop_codon:yes gene_type:complete